MRTLTRLLLALPLVISVSGLTAGTIDFEGVSEGTPYGVFSSADGVNVTFGVGPGLSPTLSAWGALTPASASDTGEVAFVDNDTPNPADPESAFIGEGFLTDEENGPTVGNNYFMTFDIAVSDLSLHLLDYRVDGGPGVTDFATLEVFSNADWTGATASDTFTIPVANPGDGNVELLQVLNPGFGVSSARVTFSALDIGTGIDNVSWTTIPEPGTVVLFGTGLLAIAAFARKRRKG